MANVATIPSKSNADLQHVLTWLEKMGDRGVLSPSGAKLRATAIRQLMEVLASDEDHSAVYFSDQLDAIGARYANVKGANPDTVRTYLSRARGSLKLYFEYLANPVGFSPTSAKPATASPGKKPRKKPPVEAGSESGVANTSREASSPPAPAPEVDGRTFPLDRAANRHISFQLPADGIASEDVAKFALHLLTLCEDFSPELATVFAGLQRAAKGAEIVRG